MADTGSLTLSFQFENSDEEPTVTVANWEDPMIALAALRRAGSDDQLTEILNKMRATAE